MNRIDDVRGLRLWPAQIALDLILCSDVLLCPVRAGSIGCDRPPGPSRGLEKAVAARRAQVRADRRVR